MNQKSRFSPAAPGITPADIWKNRRNPLAAEWHLSSTRQGGRAWREALIDSAESVAAHPEAKP